ncbi:MAG: hypothetical protein JRJ04_01805 [Deltaproteobacteria bacterium]|nr:hypothetical protein [Deltaproteobacteria bacterium]
MNLRHILSVLALLAFFSASSGGYLYYSSLRASAFSQAERQAISRVEMIKNHLSAYLSEHVKPAKTLSGMTALSRALMNPNHRTLNEANAARHAACGHVEVKVKVLNGHLLLRVEDDGQGFHTEAIAESRGFGLAGMKERANLAGGVLKIQSKPGAGTRIFCKLPMDTDSVEVL